jgi:hypothetical protein
MLLRDLSDASFLSHPKASSVAGGFSYLGLSAAADWVNHPISCHSTCILVVYSFVAEAEYAGLYAAARWATPNPPSPCSAITRLPSVSLPTPSPKECRRPPTCACIGSGTGSAKSTFASYSSADFTTSPTFFTKLLPVTRHRVLAPSIAADPEDDDSTIDNLTISSTFLLLHVNTLHHAGVFILM